MAPLNLLPRPRKLTFGDGIFPNIAPDLQRVDDPAVAEQAYVLKIDRAGVTVTAGSRAGFFYAAKTLEQIAGQSPAGLPFLTIEDAPDFAARGVMLDVSRDKVPTMATLLALIDRLAAVKINQLQLYTEHTFAYAGHEAVWERASPVTADEIRTLDRYCRERFIELVPNQNSFGHMERWLKRPAYAAMAEAIDGAETPWGFRWQGPFSLCPTDPAVPVFLAGLYDQLLPNFTSNFFNVGMDETFDIGQGRSKAAADVVGVHRVYLDFLKRVNGLVKDRGKRMMFWGDVILHQPDLIPELPKDAVAMQWGYEADHPFEKEAAAFAAAGIRFYVCPGTSSWNSVAGRVGNAVANLKAAAVAGKKYGAIGYLVTDWGDNGHLQYLPFSYPGFALGAGVSWCYESNQALDVAAALDRHFLDAPAGPLGQVVLDLGEVYQAVGKPNTNGSALFRLLVPSPMDATPEKGLTEAGLASAAAAIDRAVAPVSDPPQGLVAAELTNAAAMLRRCVDIGREKLNLPPVEPVDLQDLVAEHRRLWLARNRPGGLAESVSRLRPPSDGAADDHR